MPLGRPLDPRWWRGDAARWVRPDAARWFKPGTDLRDVFPALAEKAFNPNQPRVPAGDPDGGQWTDGYAGGDDYGNDSPAVATPMGAIDFGDVGSETGSLGLFESTPRETDRDDLVQVAGDDGKPLLDAFGEPYYSRGGHHELQRSIYERWNLPEETKRVFDQATTGELPRGYTDIEGRLRGHYWDRDHREYGDALQELADRYLRENKIETSRMTPDQARDLLKEIRESEEPRIRDYNRAMRILRRVFRIRGGRE